MMLKNARMQVISEGNIDNKGYPAILNYQGIVDTLRKFCKLIAEKSHVDAQPDQVWITIKETPEEHEGSARYAIVIEDEERLMGDARTIAVIMLYVPTREMESLSVFTDAGIQWSADNQATTMHADRTTYYLGFISLIAEKTPNYDKEPEPEYVLSTVELQSKAFGTIPTQLQPEPDINQQSDTIIMNNDETQEQGTDKDYAGTWHNGQTKEQENKHEEEVVNDLQSDFEALTNLSDT